MARETETPRILVVEDHRHERDVLCRLLKRVGWEPFGAADGVEALEKIREVRPHVLLLDLSLPRMHGFEVLTRAREMDPHLQVIMISGQGDIHSAVRSLKAGAADYLPKPVLQDDTIRAIRSALDRQALHHTGAGAPEGTPTLSAQMGSGEAIRRLEYEVDRVATTDFSVLLAGEHGTGKALVARTLQRHSLRREAPFLAVDCSLGSSSRLERLLFGSEKNTGEPSRIRPGRIELARGGTLLLREVSALPRPLQDRLGQVLQDRGFRRVGGRRAIGFDVRLLATTTEPLLGTESPRPTALSPRLYHRLAEYVIEVPPLRDRPEDVPFLVERFLRLAGEELNESGLSISREALAVLENHDWPGNTRELCEVIRRAALLARDTIGEEHLTLPAVPPPSPRATSTLEDLDDLGRVSLRSLVKKRQARLERAAIERALAVAGGNKAEAARILQVDYKTLYNKLKTYDLYSPS